MPDRERRRDFRNQLHDQVTGLMNRGGGNRYLSQAGDQAMRGPQQPKAWSQAEQRLQHGPQEPRAWRQAERAITGGQQPRMWSQVEGRLGQRLDPGYSAFGPQESDAMYQAMQRRINEGFDQQGRALSESLNQRGLYRTGLYDELQHQMVEDPRSQALSQAATDVYLAGQDATRSDVNNALAMALGLGGQQAGLQQQNIGNLLALGGQQAGLQQQHFANLLGLGGQQAGLQQQNLANLLGLAQLQHQADYAPLQAGLGLWQGMYQPQEMMDFQARMAGQDRQAQQQQQRSNAWGGLLQGIGTAAGFILPKLFGLPF